MGLNGRHFVNKVDQIMKKHWGIGMKTFKFDGSCFDTSKLNDWLQIAVTSRIEELKISLYQANKPEHYNFPCSLLFSGSGGNSIRSLDLIGCAFRPMAGLGCLTSLHLFSVHITEDELGCLLSSSFALETLHLTVCTDIICLKIPCLLHRLSKLKVTGCEALKVIENKAPNLRTVSINSDIVHHSIGDSLRVKDLEMSCSSEFNLVHHACAKLPASMPNLETLSIFLVGEVMQTRMKHVSVLQNSSHLRQMPGLCHGNIKKVEIIGFCSAKSMIELTCCILENATSLKCLTLDTIAYDMDIGDVDAYRLNRHKSRKCFSEGRRMVAEAHKAVWLSKDTSWGKFPPRSS